MVSDLLDETVRRYPHQDLSAIDQFRADWMTLAQEMGWDNFEVAVKRARMKKFFPCPEEIQENIPVPNARQTMRYEQNCDHCGGLGWKNVGPAMPSPDNPNPHEDRYKRCHCAQITAVAV